ncbi:MAG: hypothetical protein ACOYJ5_06965 [Acutalibacteraceae bacterium]
MTEIVFDTECVFSAVQQQKGGEIAPSGSRPDALIFMPGAIVRTAPQ